MGPKSLLGVHSCHSVALLFLFGLAFYSDLFARRVRDSSQSWLFRGFSSFPCPVTLSQFWALLSLLIRCSYPLSTVDAHGDSQGLCFTLRCCLGVLIRVVLAGNEPLLHWFWPKHRSQLGSGKLCVVRTCKRLYPAQSGAVG